MTALKTIVITWTNNDPSRAIYKSVHAALWIAEGTDTDLNEALAYVAAYHRGDRANVHTFPTSELNWKIKALQAHVNGHGL